MKFELEKYFIEEPNKEYHVREIAKIAKISPTTASKYLQNMEKAGLLISKKKLNHLLFKANAENANYKDMKLFLNMQKIRKSGLIEGIIKEYNYPEAIVLFGSFRKSENTPKSDIDILVITSSKKSIDFKHFEKILGNKVQLFLHSKEELNKFKTSNKELLNNFINGIALYGFWEVF